jgi:antitoxin (DNA-binding transcriptional repressor) of toxin-antitoxin stability system
MSATASVRRIPATAAAKNFGTLVDRVRDDGAIFLIERHGRAVAQIGPVSAVTKATLRGLAEYMKRTPKLDEAALRFAESGVDALNRPAIPKNPWER